MASTRKAEFDHKRHAPLKLPCGHCHATANKAANAGFPPAAVCQSCHPDRPLPGRFPARRVYKVRDYVIFSHARHLEARIACTKCHGDVAAMAKVVEHYPVTMKACVDCHKQHKASLDCAVCHELGR